MIEFYSAVNQWMTTNRLGVTGTIISCRSEHCSAGAKFLADETGRDILGQIDTEIMALLNESIQDVLRTKAPKVANVVYLNGSIKVFLDPILPQPRLLILGGGHIAVPLAEMGKLLEFHVSIVDDRLSFANPTRFQSANQVLCQNFEKAIREFPSDTNTYVIIVTRGHRHDKTCLAEVLRRKKSAYIGMIGSRRKVAALIEDLREEGFTEEELKNVYAPIGLDIGAQTPAEIAVSIIAEIIMVRRYGYSDGLKTQQGGMNNG